jgi:hypothetical protein
MNFRLIKAAALGIASVMGTIAPEALDLILTTLGVVMAGAEVGQNKIEKKRT